MKFTVKQSDLQAGLASAKRVTSGRVIHPALAGVLIEADDENLTLKATNLELWTTVRVKAEVEKPGRVLLPAARLVDLVSRLNGELSFERSEPASGAPAMIIRQGTSRFSIREARVDDFPIFQDVTGKTVNIPAQAWKKAVKRVMITAAAPLIRPSYAGVMFRFAGDHIVLAAYDGYRIASEKILVEDGVGEGEEIMAPLDALREIESLLDNAGDLTVTWQKDDGTARFETAGFVITCRLIDSQFVKFDDRIPKPVDMPIVINKDRLLASLGRAQLYTVRYTDVNKQIVTNAVVILSAEDRYLHIDAETDEGDLHEVIELEKPVSPIRRKFAVNYLMAPLKYLGDTVELHIKPGTAGSIEGSGVYREDNYFYLAMAVFDSDLEETGGVG